MSAAPRSSANEQGQGIAQRLERASAPSLCTNHPPHTTLITLIILTTLATLVATAPSPAAPPDGRGATMSGPSVSSTGTGPYGEIACGIFRNYTDIQPQPYGLPDTTQTIAVAPTAAPVRPVLCSATCSVQCSSLSTTICSLQCSSLSTTICSLPRSQFPRIGFGYSSIKLFVLYLYCILVQDSTKLHTLKVYALRRNGLLTRGNSFHQWSGRSKTYCNIKLTYQPIDNG